MANPQETFTKLQTNAIIWTLSSVALLLLLLRMMIRFKVDGRLKIDDGLVILTMICLLTSDIMSTIFSPKTFIIQAVRIGHRKPPADFGAISALFANYQWATAYLFFTGIWAVKGSFLAYYDGLTRRLTHFRRAWWATIAFTILTYIGSLLAYAFLDGIHSRTNLRNEAIKYQFAADFSTDAFSTYLQLA